MLDERGRMVLGQAVRPQALDETRSKYVNNHLLRLVLAAAEQNLLLILANLLRESGV